MGVGEDRLSTLPDELLFVIISLLPFKEAVRIAFLSKRWRFLPVTCLRTMEFRESEFITVTDSSYFVALKKQRPAFLDFVIGWIRRCRLGNHNNNSNDPGSSRFTFAVASPEAYITKIQRSVLFNAASKVDFVEINFSDPRWNEDDVAEFRPDAFVLIPCIRGKAFKSLQSLKLSACAIPDISPRCDGFPGLKSVTLEWMTMQKGSGFLNKWLRKCPALQDLTMRRCAIDERIEIASKSLKSLIMEKCCSTNLVDAPALIINAPGLKFLKYSGVLVSFGLISTDQDLEASLDFGLQEQFDMAETYADTLWRSLNELSNVKTLTVCSYVLQVLPNGEEAEDYMNGANLHMRDMARLEHLTLKASLIIEEFYGITFFLNCCPNLEVLTIDLDLDNSPHIVFPDYDGDLPFDIEGHSFVMDYENEPVFPCLASKLKRVVVEGFRGGNCELCVLKYLLKYGMVLESVHINILIEANGKNSWEGEEEEEDYLEEAKSLLKFEKASAFVRILITSTHVKSSSKFCHSKNF